jgi:hypothetical protein
LFCVAGVIFGYLYLQRGSTAWLRRQLAFEQPLVVAAADFNRYSDLPIVIETFRDFIVPPGALDWSSWTVSVVLVERGGPVAPHSCPLSS